MASGEKFCLRWNDFETNISTAFREIREEKDLFDCTIAVGSKQLQAHKLILSACSPFFREIFKQNPHQHPLLYLSRIGFDDLKACLNFMYHGEVNVAQDDLNTFLVVAEELKIKGLTQNNAEKDPMKSDLSQSVPVPRQAAPIAPPPPKLESAPKRPRLPPAASPVVQSVIDDDIVEVEPEVKTEPHHDLALAPMAEESYEEGYDYGEYAPESVDYEGAMVEHGDSGKGLARISDCILKSDDGSQYTCKECGKSFKDHSNCRRHVKTLHFVELEAAVCCFCNQRYKNRNSLLTHISMKHRTHRDHWRQSESETF